MLEILRACLASGSHRLGVATIVEVSGSAPRGVGTSMALTESEIVIGSLSSGCVDSEILEACRTALVSGESSVHVFGYAPDDPFGIGLACGGTVTVVVAPADRGMLLRLCPAVEGKGFARLTWGEGPNPRKVRDDGTATEAGLVARWRWHPPAAAASRKAEPGDHPVHVAIHDESKPPTPRALIYGANDFGVAAAAQLQLLGFDVEVCDPRRAFTDAARFPGSRVEVDSPLSHVTERAEKLTERDVVLMLAHDARFDAPVLKVALDSAAGYVGALGSRVTDAARRARLRDLEAADLDRLHSPVGLNLGARSPEEVAVAIAAEIVAHRHGHLGTITPLHRSSGRLHGTEADSPAAPGGTYLPRPAVTHACPTLTEGDAAWT